LYTQGDVQAEYPLLSIWHSRVSAESASARVNEALEELLGSAGGLLIVGVGGTFVHWNNGVGALAFPN
jgi:hypothetical protein